MTFDKNNGICLSLGFFDCMHVGHRALVAEAEAYAKKNGCETVLFTFTDSPKQGKSVYVLPERRAIYAECGVDRVIECEFDERTRDTEPIAFLDGLTKREKIKAFFCGEDYTFGARGSGDARLLEKYCARRGIDARVTRIVGIGGVKVSSTRVRELLERGDVDGANKLLGAPYRITAEVVKGRGEGGKIGFPTANLKLDGDKIYPKNGVYLTTVAVDEKIYSGATNVGTKPTFGDETISIETFIDGFDGSLYGKTITVFFTRRLRDIEKFSSSSELAERIRADVRKGEELCLE